MKLRIELDGQDYQLDLLRDGTQASFSVTNSGGEKFVGEASVLAVAPGIYSVLLENRSHTVYLANAGDKLEVWAHGRGRILSVTDARDDVERPDALAGTGRFELRTPMPGKVIKILVQPHSPVHAGQGLIVVEAMKMQNEIKSPKDGVVSKVYAVEGETVGAGTLLVVVE